MPAFECPHCGDITILTQEEYEMDDKIKCSKCKRKFEIEDGERYE